MNLIGDRISNLTKPSRTGKAKERDTFRGCRIKLTVLKTRLAASKKSLKITTMMIWKMNGKKSRFGSLDDCHSFRECIYVRE